MPITGTTTTEVTGTTVIVEEAFTAPEVEITIKMEDLQLIATIILTGEILP